MARGGLSRYDSQQCFKARGPSSLSLSSYTVRRSTLAAYSVSPTRPAYRSETRVTATAPTTDMPCLPRVSAAPNISDQPARVCWS